MALANISNPLGGGAGATSGRIAGGVLYGLNGQTITGNSSGAWAIVANGTNQNLTLTPSGTGDVIVSTDLVVSGTTAATSTTTGALQVAGGVGVAGAGYFGGNLQAPGAIINDVAGGNRSVVYRTSGSTRWVARANSTAESGANAGSDYNIVRYDDTGAEIGNALTVTRSSGAVALSGNLTIGGVSIESTDARSGAGAISVTATTTRLTTTAADALTLADGTAGQIKRIVMVADGGDGTLTPTTKTGFTTITFNDVGDAVTLQFFTTLGWMIVSNYGCTVA